MDDEGRRGAADVVRHVVLSLERFAAHGIASGAVRGATEELEAEIPELSAEVRLLLANSIALLNQVAQVLSEEPPQRVAQLSEAAAAGAAIGLARAWPGVARTTQEVVRVIDEALGRLKQLAEERAEADRAPGFRARQAAASGVEGALESIQKGRADLDALLQSGGQSVVHGMVGELRTDLDDLVAGLAAPARTLGTELTRGVLMGLREQLRSPVLRAAGIAGVLLGVTGLGLLVVRRA